jgi:hypothetical protein
MGRKLIGFCGYARSGKDAAAKVLVERHGFVKVSFAEPLRKMLYALNPIIAYFGLCDEAAKRVQDVVDALGWDQAKVMYPEIRYLLQRLGTEAGRRHLGDSVWVDLAMAEVAKHDKVVITDCRFANEARAIHLYGGVVVKVSRPGVGPVNSHVSDQELPDIYIDHTISNDGTLDDLAEKIESLYAKLA